MVLVLVLEAFGLVEYEYEYRFTEYEYDQIGNLWVKSRAMPQAYLLRPFRPAILEPNTIEKVAIPQHAWQQLQWPPI